MYSVHVLCVVKVSKGLVTGDQPLPYRSIERPRTRTRTRISHKRRNDAPAPVRRSRSTDCIKLCRFRLKIAEVHAPDDVHRMYMSADLHATVYVHDTVTYQECA